MWSHEHDAYSLTKQEKGGRVWEYLEGVVGWMKGGALPLFSANCFSESELPNSSYQVRSPQHPVWAGYLRPCHTDKLHHVAFLSSNSRIWGGVGGCLGIHFLAIAELPAS